jgi:hypothetical protein
MARELIKVKKRAARTRAVPISGEASPDSGESAAMTSMDADHRRALIAEAAYYRSLHHASGGSEVDDWLAAEREVDAKLTAPSTQ